MKLLLIALGLFPIVAAAATTTSWKNPDCEVGDCELRAVKFSISKDIDLRNRLAGNSLVAEIETSKKEQLRDYAFVQYIRGCHFATDASGVVNMGRRDFFARANQEFNHKGWQLDSAWDTDPIYWSFTGDGFDELRGFEVPRNGSYLTDDPTRSEQYDWWAGKVQNLKSSKIYATDAPTASSWRIEGGRVKATVSSLQFKICVHRVSDIPKSVVGPSVEIPGALYCFEWSSNYQMNFTRGQLEERATLHPACARE